VGRNLPRPGFAAGRRADGGAAATGFDIADLQHGIPGVGDQVGVSDGVAEEASAEVIVLGVELDDRSDGVGEAGREAALAARRQPAARAGKRASP